MITQEQIELITEILINRVEKLNTKILKEIGKNIKKIGTLKATDVMRLSAIIKYGGSYETILEELAKTTELNRKDIEKIFREVSKKDYEFANKFYKYREIDRIPFEQNVMLQNQINSIAMSTIEEYVKQTTMLGYGLVDDDGKVIFNGIRDAFNDLVDDAILSVSQGKETYREVMYRQLKEMGSGGLRVIYPTTYIGKDGKEHHYTRRLDSVLRTTIQDGLRTLHNENQKVFGQEFGADGYEISVHSNPAIDHEEVQGRQFSIEEYEKLNMGLEAKDYKGKTYTLDHNDDGNIRPIGELNCYHYIFPIILGVSDPEYTDKELNQIIEDNNKGFEFDGKHYTNYEGTQLQRQLETKIREQKDAQILAKESGQDDLVRDAQKNITDLTRKYKELSQASGLPTKMQRLRVSGYKRTKTK